MRQSEWSLRDARNELSAVVDAASKGVPQTITKRGKPVVVVLSVAQYNFLKPQAEERRPSFVEHLLAFPKGPFKLKRMQLKPRDVDFGPKD